MAIVERLAPSARESLAMKLLIIDDEPAITQTLETKYRKEGFTTFIAGSAEDGMAIFKRAKPDLVILDIMLPQRSGFDLCRQIRKESPTPIIFVSARADEADRIAGLEMGADDYVDKPFNWAELVAGVNAILRRATGEPIQETVERGDLKIDPRTHEAFLRGEKLVLSPKEFALLYFLSRHAGQVFTREVLLDRVWGKDAYVSSRTVDVHIRWLRTRIELDPDKPERVLTVRGIGYKFLG